jgi:hypothetical protein
MKRTRTIKRYVISVAGLVIGLIACGVAYKVHLAPKQQRVQALQQRVSALESEKSAIQATLTPPNAGGGHPHRHGPGGAHDDEYPEANMRAMRILGADQTLGVRAVQLRTIEELAAAAEEAGVERFSYQNLSDMVDSPEQVMMVTRHPEGGTPHEQHIYRYVLHTELTTNYEGLVGFLSRIESLPQVVTPRELRLSKGADGVTRAQLTLSGYFWANP